MVIKHAIETRAGLASTRTAVRGNPYKIYVLGVILLANTLNYADRSVLSILTQAIKADFGISDSQMGFLFGTSFVLVHGLLAMAAARLADVWLRQKLLALGIVLWSIMTAASGFSRSYVQLAGARFGVGVGESAIAPVAHSLLADIFPAQQRGRAYSVYLCGTFLGTALCTAVGGWLLGAWPHTCVAWGLCQVKAWQATFFVFGVPGLIVALLAVGIGEPFNAQQRGRTMPIAEGLRELSMIVPPFALWRLRQFGGWRAAGKNLAFAAIIAALVAAMLVWTGDRAQWLAVGLGAYAATSWIQTLAYREPALSRLTVGSPAFRAATIATGIIGILSAAFAFWTIPLALRNYGVSPQQAATTLAIATAGGSFAGTLVGGFLADWWRRRSPAAPLWVGVLTIVGLGVTLAVLLAMHDLRTYCVTLGVLMAFCGMWTAPLASLIQDLILPTMRARAAVMFSMSIMLMSLSLGPYTVGRIADLTGSLGTGLGSLFTLAPISVGLLIYAIRKLPAAFAERLTVEKEFKLDAVDRGR
jgi:MFS family permease